MSIGQLFVELQENEVEKSSYEKSIIGIIPFCLSPHKRCVLALKIYILTKKIIDFSTSSYHNFVNIGPNDMFFTKKCNYFSQEGRWNNLILSQST